MVPPRLKGGCAASSSTTGKTTKHFWHPKPLSPPSHPCHDTMATALTPKSPRALRTGGTHLSLHGGGRAWGPSRSLRGLEGISGVLPGCPSAPLGGSGGWRPPPRPHGAGGGRWRPVASARPEGARGERARVTWVKPSPRRHLRALPSV